MVVWAGAIASTRETKLEAAFDRLKATLGYRTIDEVVQRFERTAADNAAAAQAAEAAASQAAAAGVAAGTSAGAPSAAAKRPAGGAKGASAAGAPAAARQGGDPRLSAAGGSAADDAAHLGGTSLVFRLMLDSKVAAEAQLMKRVNEYTQLETVLARSRWPRAERGCGGGVAPQPSVPACLL